MSEFIPIAVAHDATCKKGDEWLFHGMAENKEDLRGESRHLKDINARVAFIPVIAIQNDITSLVAEMRAWTSSASRGGVFSKKHEKGV